MNELISVLPAIALRGTTILPDMIVHFDISRDKSGQGSRRSDAAGTDGLSGDPERSHGGRTRDF